MDDPGRTQLALESGMPASEDAYRQIALEDPDGHWELHCGVLRQKPGMSFAHSHVECRLFRVLVQQLDDREFEVRADFGRVRRSPENYYIPDVFVVPAELARRGFREQPRALEVYEDLLPLVVEIWSPSTGTYDVEAKLPEYQRRGDPWKSGGFSLTNAR